MKRNKLLGDHRDTRPEQGFKSRVCLILKAAFSLCLTPTNDASSLGLFDELWKEQQKKILVVVLNKTILKA